MIEKLPSPPFGLSLSTPFTFLPFKKGLGFDKLSPNGG